jgi:hypothetical protein
VQKTASDFLEREPSIHWPDNPGDDTAIVASVGIATPSSQNLSINSLRAYTSTGSAMLPLVRAEQISGQPPTSNITPFTLKLLADRLDFVVALN